MTPLTVTIPNDWTPAQALAAYEAVDALREAIWSWPPSSSAPVDSVPPRIATAPNPCVPRSC